MWSTVVDAPVSPPLSKEEFVSWYLQYFGGTMAELEERLTRAEKTGCSAYDLSFEDCVFFNRAGPEESCLSLEDFIKKYC